MNGNGRLCYGPQNQVKVGQFFDKNLDGYGICYFQDGSTYTGYYKKGQRHGYGRYIMPGGQLYEGLFYNGDYFYKGSTRTIKSKMQI